MIAWSYGGGVQSVAIGVLIHEGVLPRPELSVIADTGRERRTTWEYLRDHMQPFLDPVGVTIQIAPHSLAGKWDLYAADGTPLVPAYDGAEGRLSTFCSGKWKADVVQRWLRQQGVRECVQWIGYSMDELWRAKKDKHHWCRTEYPLIEKWINRAMCYAIIEKAGLPIPKKSRCYGCPHQSDAEWQEVKEDPVDWPKAVAMDEEVRRNDPQGKGLYLYSGRVPLALADFTHGTGIVAPARPCETGHCWT